MSKAFTNEDNLPEDDDQEEEIVINDRNMMTPVGHKALQDEFYFLWREERPRITEIVSWAAGNGDRSENGDYLYGKKKLREIDRRLRYLTKRLEKPEIVDPAQQQGIDQVFFGATVTYLREDDSKKKVQLVGVDEADLSKGKINWQSPVARALMKGKVGDTPEVKETGEVLEIVKIEYII